MKHDSLKAGHPIGPTSLQEIHVFVRMTELCKSIPFVHGMQYYSRKINMFEENCACKNEAFARLLEKIQTHPCW